MTHNTIIITFGMYLDCDSYHLSKITYEIYELRDHSKSTLEMNISKK